MAKPSAATAAARVVLTACLNVAFVLLLLVFCLSRRTTGGNDASVSVRSSFPNDGTRRGALLANEARGHGGGCDGLQRLASYEARCGYLAAGSDRGCRPRGYVDYLQLFYCVFGRAHRALGYGAMAAWLAALFYLLGDTAAVYFCSSLEGLSQLLGLSPAIAGATLLSLGNGAPDALSTLASFAKGGTISVGLNSVLGGALFVSSAVLGVIGLRLGDQGVAVDRASFFRDASFLLLALAAVAVVLAQGEVTIWAALGFASLYLIYVLAVAFTPKCWSRCGDTAADDFAELNNVIDTKFYTDHEAQEHTAPLIPSYAGGSGAKKKMNGAGMIWAAARVLELPLSLPRRMTIPDASKERWSKPAAVTASTLAPVFLSCLWSHHAAGEASLAVLVGGLTGLVLGLFAFLTTDHSAPPTRFLAVWLAAGFAMSVAWAYVITNEVLSLLVSAGVVLSVDTATLGVTVLAWGNSLGDLIANVAVASRGSGAQVAVAGCYGGPLFNVLMGLGLSMLLSCWAGYPQPLEIPREPRLYQTLCFVAAGLLWALVMLPRRGMRVDRTLGFGLLAVYSCFLCIKIWQLESQL